MSAPEFLMYTSIFAPTIPLGIGLLFLKRLDVDQKLLLGLMGLSLLVQIIALIIAMQPQSNHFLFHFYTPLEFIVLGYIYKLWLKDWWNKKIFEYSILGIVGFCVINALFFQPLEQMNSYAVLLESILLIIFSIAYFYRVLNEMSIKALESSHRFWINTSVLLYYSGSLLILGFTDLLFEKTDTVRVSIWAFHSSFNILHYVLFGIGLWLKPNP